MPAFRARCLRLAPRNPRWADIVTHRCGLAGICRAPIATGPAKVRLGSPAASPVATCRATGRLASWAAVRAGCVARRTGHRTIRRAFSLSDGASESAGLKGPTGSGPRPGAVVGAPPSRTIPHSRRLMKRPRGSGKGDISPIGIYVNSNFDARLSFAIIARCRL
jgi:hypothetical protein